MAGAYPILGFWGRTGGLSGIHDQPSNMKPIRCSQLSKHKLSCQHFHVIEQVLSATPLVFPLAPQKQAQAKNVHKRFYPWQN